VDLGKVISSPEKVSDKQAEAFVGRDEKSWKPYLKIPLPEPEVLQNLFTAFGQLLSNYKKDQ